MNLLYMAMYIGPDPIGLTAASRISDIINLVHNIPISNGYPKN